MTCGPGVRSTSSSACATTDTPSTIAEAVGEWALMVTLLSLRKGYEFNQTMQAGVWAKRDLGPGHTLIGKRVGVVAASKVNERANTSASAIEAMPAPSREAGF